MDTRDENLNKSANTSNRVNPVTTPPSTEPLRHESSNRSIQHGEYHEMDPRFEADRKEAVSTTARTDRNATSTDRNAISTDRNAISTDRDAVRSPESYKQESPSTFTQIENKLERIYDQVEQTLSSQLKLAKAEINEKIDQVESGAMSLTAGGVITFFGAQVLVFACVILLAFVMPLWGSALIVSGILLAVGFALLAKGKKDLEPSSLKPNRTINQAKETVDTVRREL